MPEDFPEAAVSPSPAGSTIEAQPFDPKAFLGELKLAHRINDLVSYKGKIATLGGALVACDWARGELTDMRDSFIEEGVADVDGAMDRYIARKAPTEAERASFDAENPKKN